MSDAIKNRVPISVDSHGSGLYAIPGGRAFIDFEHPEDRMMRQLAEEDRFVTDNWERDMKLQRDMERELNMPDPDDLGGMESTDPVELHGSMDWVEARNA